MKAGVDLFFDGNALASSFSIAIIFIAVRAFFEMEKNSDLNYKSLIIEVVFFTIILQFFNWIFSSS